MHGCQAHLQDCIFLQQHHKQAFRPCKRVATRCQAASACSRVAPSKEQTESIADAIMTLKEAARTRAVPKKLVFSALQAVERKGPAEQDWEAVIAQPSPSEGGRRAWQTVYTQNAAANRWRERLPGNRAQEQKLGSFFLGTLVNTFAPAGGEFSMAVHSGHWAFLKLTGPYRFSGNTMTFEVKSAQVGLFPFKLALPLSIAGPSEGRSNGFKYLYADGEIVVARGARGGIALLARAPLSWLLEHAVEVLKVHAMYTKTRVWVLNKQRMHNA
ncbi:hypothetical protein WJX81_006017 [Elliptochloris bilobata]|uniref:Plastid lipid-associated protein/fibrillin conserved domain-containing protein n=1 Tax=Elliptochloris bilobata TaxID=381761 RepID=A0AAW1RYN1_9CHLO